MRKALLVAAIAAVASVGSASTAAAHTISIGFENAGPGSVNIWLGTYATGHAALTTEGSLKLEGVNGTVFGPTIVPFNMVSAVKPGGLVDGTTNFYIPNISDPNAALVGSEAGFNASCPACGPVSRWQGVNFSGLSAGFYQFTYIPIANPTAQWDILNNNMNGIFDLSGVVVAPEPATLSLLGLGLVGLVARRRGAAK